MEEAKTNTNIQRPPIVVVLGHVDHGKTSLLDAIRKTNVAAREAGGITQKIGSSVVTTKEGKRITFIDTPGHAAFSAMRGRGAQVADIALLIVAADDGVQPQTKEAIRHIKAAGIPFIVTVTKVDLPTSDLQKTLSQLENEGVFLEKRGGDTPWIEVSSKTGQGIEELLDLISLISEVEGLSGDEKGDLEAVVIESAKDKGGPLANIVVRNGSIKVGDIVYIGQKETKVRSISGENGQVKIVKPGEPAQILGFEEIPSVGSIISSTPRENTLLNKDNTNKVSDGEIGIYLKASNAGSLEAVMANLPEKVVVMASGVGDVNESDVMSAKSLNVVGIFVFEAKTPSSVAKLAETEDIAIYSYRIIYELFDKLVEIIKGGEVVVLGKAEIKAEFPFDNKRVAGCKVITGRITKGDKLVLTRGDVELGKIKIISLKKAKMEVPEVRQGEEFGMIFAPQLDFTIGDAILALK